MTLTLELDEKVVAKARILAEQRNSTVSDVVSDAIERFAPECEGSGASPSSAAVERARRWQEMLERVGTFDTGGPYTRDEMNER